MPERPDARLDRRSILQNIIGRTVRRLVIDEFGRYLHFLNDNRYLALHASHLHDSDELLLEWFEDADRPLSKVK